MGQFQIIYFTSQYLPHVQNNIYLLRIGSICFICINEIDIVIGLFIVCLFKHSLCNSGNRVSKVQRWIWNDMAGRVCDVILKNNLTNTMMQRILFWLRRMLDKWVAGTHQTKT
jgi:hypothetical protein